jgi:hypothetical protein
MDRTQPLEIKVVYSASTQRSRPRPVRGRSPSGHARLVVLGLLNLLAAGGVYYGTCWQADPELRIALITHTPLPVDIDQAAAFLPASRQQVEAGQRGGPEPAAPSDDADPEAGPGTTSAPTGPSQPGLFVGTVIGWEVLCVLSACALSLSGGALLARGGRVWRGGGIVLGAGGLMLLGWQAYGLWQRFEAFVPDQQRLDVGAAVLLVALIGLIRARGARGLTFVAAVLLIVSAAGSVFGLHVARQYEAFDETGLPVSFPLLLVLVFVLHSLWGWILLPLASRIPR